MDYFTSSISFLQVEVLYFKVLNTKQVAKYAQATDKLRREAVNALPEIKM
jgi:hypothetical protein